MIANHKKYRLTGLPVATYILDMKNETPTTTTQTEADDMKAHAALIVAECERVYGPHVRTGYAGEPCYACGTEYALEPAPLPVAAAKGAAR